MWSVSLSLYRNKVISGLRRETFDFEEKKYFILGGQSKKYFFTFEFLEGFHHSKLHRQRFPTFIILCGSGLVKKEERLSHSWWFVEHVENIDDYHFQVFDICRSCEHFIFIIDFAIFLLEWIWFSSFGDFEYLWLYKMFCWKILAFVIW